MSKKDGLVVAIMKGLKKKHEDEPDERLMVAEDIREAIADKDDEALVEALQAFISLCGDK